MNNQKIFDTIAVGHPVDLGALLLKKKLIGSGYKYDVLAECNGLSVWEKAILKGEEHADQVWFALARRMPRDEVSCYVFDICEKAVKNESVSILRYMIKKGYFETMSFSYQLVDATTKNVWDLIEPILNNPNLEILRRDLYGCNIRGLRTMIADTVYESNSPEQIELFVRYGSINDVSPEVIAANPKIAALFETMKQENPVGKEWDVLLAKAKAERGILPPVTKVVTGKLPDAVVARAQEENIPVRTV